jgi:hypothetical protein
MTRRTKSSSKLLLATVEAFGWPSMTSLFFSRGYCYVVICGHRVMPDRGADMWDLIVGVKDTSGFHENSA